MSEAITKACPAKDCDDGLVRDGGATFRCKTCNGLGLVPDVEATLRAEVARLTEQNAYLTSERERLIPLAVQAQKNAPPPVFVLPPGVDGDIVALRVDNTRLTAEVERLKGREREAEVASLQDLLRRAVDIHQGYEAEVTELRAEVERLTKRDKAAEAMFRDGEWNGRGRYWFGPCCPNCGGTTDTGHGADCPRAPWLAGCKS